MQKLIYSIFVLFICFIGYSQTDPTAQFTANPLVACVGEEITFTSTSTAGSSPIVSWEWNFDKGFNGTGATTKFSYLIPGKYTITLSVTDQNGNADKDAEIKFEYITIVANPLAQFLINANNCKLPVIASFVNQSETGSNITYNWDFGNTQTSTNQSPSTITYPTSGNYNVTLDVKNTTTNCHSTVSKTISTSDFTTDFTAPDSICLGGTANFTDNSSVGVNSWSWDFDNVVGDPSQNSSHIFNVAGTYPIKLTSKNTVSGCISTKTKQLIVVATPVPTFTASSTSGCIDLKVTFTNTTNEGSNFIWDFGDFTTYSGKTPPEHTYTTNGFFDVKLTATGKHGCIGTNIVSNMIHTLPPSVIISATPTSGCTPLNVQFTDQSSSANSITDPIVSWEWNFGDLGTSTLQNPTHTFTTGKYDITLKIKTKLGCEDTKSFSEFIKVGEIDLVNFSLTPPIICAKNQIVTFTNSSEISKPYTPGEVIYEWEFGDPNGQGKSSLKDPTYNYPADSGYMNVKLTVSFRGCKKFIQLDNAVFVNPPIAKFEASKVCNPTNFPVNIPTTDNAIIGRKGNDIKIIWKWGDPLDSKITIEPDSFDPSSFSGSSDFDYNDYGTYTIWQVIHNKTTGCSDSTSKEITISKVIPDFTLSATAICKNGSVTMTGNSSSTPATGFPITSYDYSMGDGGSTIGNGIPTATYQYTTAKTYNIEMSATNSVGCTGTKSVPNAITVYELPTANINFPVNICGPSVVTFTNTSSKVGNGFPTFSSFEWTMPRNSGNQTTNSLGATTQFNFSLAGNFHDSISLIATDGFGCVSLPTKKYINMSLPSPNFSIDPVVCNKVSVNTVNSTLGSNTYKWYLDYTNGSSPIYSTNPNPSFTFNESENLANNNKTHSIKLVVTDQNSCKDSINNTITVSVPKASFKSNFTGASQNSEHVFSCPPVFATLTNQSSAFGSTYSSNWLFGDGKNSALKDPKNIYTFANTYTASLKVTDQYGCFDDTIMVDYLTIGGPSTDINHFSTGTICDNLFYFDTLNSKSIDHLIWDFGDGTSATTSYVQHSYPLAGSYTPKLTIYDNQNCSVDYPLNALTLQNEIKAYFTYTPKPGKTEEPITFDDQSIFNKPIVSWFWEYGDFDTTILLNNTDANTSFSYYYPYIYQASLTVTDANGCLSKYTAPIHIMGDFKIANVFTPNNDGVNDTFKFFHDLFKTYDVTILNRWNNVVYEKTNSSGIIIWDGSNQNKEQCTEGVYFYIVKGLLMDGTPFEKVGFVTKI